MLQSQVTLKTYCHDIKERLTITSEQPVLSSVIQPVLIGKNRVPLQLITFKSVVISQSALEFSIW
jgi:hypothetical protein